MMMRMTPLTGEGKPLDVSARLVELTGLVESAARDGLPAHELEWTLPGAQALLNLRRVALNDEWEPFMNHYIQTETARLHANIPSQPPSTRLRLVA